MDDLNSRSPTVFISSMNLLNSEKTDFQRRDTMPKGSLTPLRNL